MLRNRTPECHRAFERKEYMKTKPTSVIVNDRMQKGYRYELSEPVGRNFAPDFKPELTPAEMLHLGVFGGVYMRDCAKEFPASWWKGAKFAEWQRKGWIREMDPRGWFQWYCRYYMGRRLPEEDARQIRRWKAMRRHIGQIQANCRPGDVSCRPRQRQALLHWAYDTRR